MGQKNIFWEAAIFYFPQNSRKLLKQSLKHPCSSIDKRINKY